MEKRDRNDEKIQAKEIEVGRRPSLRKQRQHGKLYQWFDNFWYHHKWKTLISLFFVVLISVCVFQMCSKEEEGEVSVIMAGPYSFMDNEEGYNALRSCLSAYLPESVEGNRRTDLVTYAIYSEEQIKALKNHVDEEGNEDPIEINTAANAQEYSAFNDYVQTGAASIAFLDPWLFREMIGRGNLVDIVDAFEKEPLGAIYNADGECYGVRLGDTKLYKNNAAMRVLPEDTVICLIGPYFIGKSSNEEEYQKSVDYFAELVGLD